MERTLNGPEWQKDSDSQACYICESQFNFLHRRHHCRKCGKIVCGDCSSQAISYFPNTLIATPRNRRKRLQMGEVYKTCDNCIDEIRMLRRALLELSPSDAEIATNGRNYGRNEDHRSHTDDDLDETNSVDNNSTTKFSSLMCTRRLNSSTDSSVTNLSQNGLGRTRRRDRDRDRDDASDYNLCPICAENILKTFDKLVKKKQIGKEEDYEKFKEAHINDCLTAYDFNTNHERAKSIDKERPHARNKMLVYNMPPIPRPKFETIPNLGGNSDMMMQSPPQGGEFSSGSLVSNATIQAGGEKAEGLDKLDSECVICLEDLKPGDKVGRLECLCVFHYKCIKDWFNKKGYGECPVHFFHQ